MRLKCRECQATPAARRCWFRGERIPSRSTLSDPNSTAYLAIFLRNSTECASYSNDNSHRNVHYLETALGRLKLGLQALVFVWNHLIRTLPRLKGSETIENMLFRIADSTTGVY